MSTFPYVVLPEEVLVCGAVLADAFKNDPLWAAMMEDEATFRKKGPLLFETPLRVCLRYGEVMATSEHLEGIAATLPGHLSTINFWRLLRSGGLFSAMRLGAKMGQKLEKVFGVVDRDRARNMADRPFIYLQVIGVRSEEQAQGHGGRLLRHIIDKTQRQGLPLYLETETEHNASMYEHFGFRVIKKIQVPLLGLPLWEMVL